MQAISARPQPYAILGYCDVLIGAPAQAVSFMNSAVQHDPQNWFYRYGLAVATAAAGRDPHPMLRQALELNPLESTIHTALGTFAGHNPRSWARAARRAAMPLETGD
jgi:Flp pilus assembly protein TadD